MNKNINSHENASQSFTNQAPTPDITQLEVSRTLSVKQRNTPAIILLILLIFTLGLGGFFAYSYFQLTQIPILPDIQVTSDPDSTVIPTANLDSIDDWKIIINDNYGFSFKYPEIFTYKDNTGKGGDIANVPSKINLTSPTSIVSVSVQKRDCNTSASKITIGNKTGIRFSQENEMNGQLFFIDTVEVFLTDNLCLSISNNVSGIDSATDQNKNKQVLNEMMNQDKEIFEMIISTFEFTSLEIKKSVNYEISLPEGYKIQKQTLNTKEYGTDYSIYLTISTGNIIGINSLGKATDVCPTLEYDFCLSNGKNWGQDQDIQNITLDGIPAKSFYIFGGVDNAYHIIQTTQNPLIELKMYVAGGGLDQAFADIISSFKFKE